MNIINNKGLVVIASRPNQGKTYTIMSHIKDSLKENKKVLFISLENNEESIKKMLGFNNNLIIYDKPIKNTKEILKLINKNNPDTVYIDYLDLLPEQERTINLLKNENISVVVAASLSSYFDNYDFENINLNDVINNVQNYLYHCANKFIFLSNKKQYVLDTL